MALCYILYSPKLDRFYIGVTNESLSDRIEKHILSTYGNHRYTSTTDDWKAYYQIECIDFNQAINIERHLKRMKSKIYLQNLLKYPEITEKLLSKYKST